MTLTHYIGGKLTGLTVDFPPSLNYPNLTTFINTETFIEYILVSGVWEQVGVASPFVPTDIAGLKVWFDADAPSTFSFSSSNIISQWNDKSATGNNVSQGSVPAQPLLIQGVRNGKPIVRFDGVDDFLQRTTYVGGTISQGNTIFVVAEIPNIIIEYLIDSGGASDRQFINYPIANEIHAVASGGTSMIGSVTGGTWNYLTATFNGATGTLRGNGVELDAENTGAESMNGITLASRHVGDNYANMDLAEVLIYDTAILGSDLTNVETYLAEKWGFV